MFAQPRSYATLAFSVETLLYWVFLSQEAEVGSSEKLNTIQKNYSVNSSSFENQPESLKYD